MITSRTRWAVASYHRPFDQGGLGPADVLAESESESDHRISPPLLQSLIRNPSLPLSSTLLVRSGISSASIGWHCIRLVLCFELCGATFGPGSEPDFPSASAPNILTALLLGDMPSTLCRAIGHACAMHPRSIAW